MSFSRALNERYIVQMQRGDSHHQLVDTDFMSCVGRYCKLDTRYNAALFALLQNDIANGEVFPALRDDELDFYYKGGCLYKFAKGAFLRNCNYDLYSAGTEGLQHYGKAKKQNENKFTNKKGGITERQLLDDLYRYTYCSELHSNVVVLDIEVNLKGNFGRGKKCDLALLNAESDEIMFVEGKVYSDRRVKCAVGYLPEVIEQVDTYMAAMAEQRQNIIAQYSEYIRIMNGLFGTTYRVPQKLVEPAKLLVYKTGGGMDRNVRYTINAVNEKLGAGNVMWVNDEDPTLEDIWNALY